MNKTKRASVILVTVIAVGLIAGLASAVIYAALSASQTIPLQGTVSAVNLAISQNGAPITSMTWAPMDPGASATQNVTVQNTGNVPETLSLQINSLIPSGCGITLTWNQQGTVLNAGSSVVATLTLTVPSTVSGGTNYSFNAVFTGTEN